MENNQRFIEVDMVKGMAIILVVMGHDAAPKKNLIYLFHMAVFFIASGYVNKLKYSQSGKQVKEFICNKLKTLWIPYVIYCAIFILGNNLFVRWNLYTTNSAITDYVQGPYIRTFNTLSLTDRLSKIFHDTLLFQGEPQLLGAIWFLRVLFIVAVMHCILSYLIRIFIRNTSVGLCIHSVVSLAFLFLGQSGFIQKTAFLNLQIPVVFTVYCLYHLGFVMRQLQLMRYVERTKVAAVTAAGASILLLLFDRIGTIELGSNQIVSVPFYISVSVLGWLLLYTVSWLFKRNRLLANGLSLIGEYSLYIMIFHFIAFKLVNGVVALYHGWPSYTIAAFPVLTETGGWWLLYTIIGVAVPIAIGMGIKKVLIGIVAIQEKAEQRIRIKQ